MMFWRRSPTKGRSRARAGDAAPMSIAAAPARHLRVAFVMHTVQSDWAKHLAQGIVAVLGDCGAIVMETVDCNFFSDL